MSKTLFLFFIHSMLISHIAAAQEKEVVHIVWSTATFLPDLAGTKQKGVAGPFAGISNGVMLIAGGANFPGAKPWDGGRKMNRDDIYILRKLPGNKFESKALKEHLLQAVAYGASVTTGKGIVCIGGETGEASGSNNVFVMRWNKAANKISFLRLPSLPVSIANTCASGIENTVYVFGGESSGLPINKCFKLDLNAKNCIWESLPPMPVAMSHSVAVTQSNGHYSCIYIIGGRSATASGISKLHGDTFCFDPIQQKWSQLNDISDGKNSTNMSAATAVAIGNEQIVLVGGDKGDIFHKIEKYNTAIAKTGNEKKKQTLQTEKLQLVTHHPGFSRDVYLYNTITDKWQKLDGLPFYGQVTTIAVKWGNDILIPGGEIMPGTRTPAITLGVINK